MCPEPYLPGGGGAGKSPLRSHQGPQDSPPALPGPLFSLPVFPLTAPPAGHPSSSGGLCSCPYSARNTPTPPPSVVYTCRPLHIYTSCFVLLHQHLTYSKLPCGAACCGPSGATSCLPLRMSTAAFLLTPVLSVSRIVLHAATWTDCRGRSLWALQKPAVAT